MQNHLSFGTCLKLMLSILNIKPSRLAKSINVDPSLVNKWLHETRLPPFNSDYIPKIAPYISASVFTLFQKKRLGEVLTSTGIKPDAETPLGEKIKECLFEALSYSNRLKNGDATVDVKSYSSSSVIKIDPCQHNFSEKPVASDSSVDSSLNCKIISGDKSIFETILSMLEVATATPCPKGSPPIYLTFWGLGQLNPIDEKFILDLSSILSRALKNYWSIIMIFQISNNMNRILRLFKLLNVLFPHDQLKMYYLTRFDVFTFEKEICIVPGAGVLTCYSNNFTGINNAFYIPSLSAEEVLIDHLNKIITHLSKPIIKYHTFQSHLEYIESFTEIEKSLGNMYFSSDQFNESTLPVHRYPEYLDRMDLPLHEKNAALELHLKRRNIFEYNLRHFGCREIYNCEYINDFIKHRQYLLENPIQSKLSDFSPAFVIDHLKAVIQLLEKYENYEIALVRSSQQVYPKVLCAVVKERHSLYIKVKDTSKRSGYVFLSIDEPTIVSAILGHYSEVWESISPVNRDKKEIIAWLNSQIDILSRQEDTSLACQT